MLFIFVGFGVVVGFGVSLVLLIWCDVFVVLVLLFGFYLIVQVIVSFGFGGYIVGCIMCVVFVFVIIEDDGECWDGLYGLMFWVLVVFVGVVLFVFLGVVVIECLLLCSLISVSFVVEFLLSYELDKLFWVLCCVLNIDFREVCVEVGWILMMLFSYSGVSVDDCVYFIQQVVGLIGFQVFDFEWCVDVLIVELKMLINWVWCNLIIVVFLIVVVIFIGVVVVWVVVVVGGWYCDGEFLLNWMVSLNCFYCCLCVMQMLQFVMVGCWFGCCVF